ncbi:MAG: hypothetical protein HRU40_07320 [Saprospiraceae bacterium]|nr:hypothetical protein [Saprospiraceae bacterium]
MVNKAIKLVLAVFVLAMVHNVKAQKPLPVKATTFKQCPDEMTFVIRCDYGKGYCEPSSQVFCDEIAQ